MLVYRSVIQFSTLNLNKFESSKRAKSESLKNLWQLEQKAPNSKMDAFKEFLNLQKYHSFAPKSLYSFWLHKTNHPSKTIQGTCGGRKKVKAGFRGFTSVLSSHPEVVTAFGWESKLVRWNHCWWTRIQLTSRVNISSNWPLFCCHPGACLMNWSLCFQGKKVLFQKV